MTTNENNKGRFRLIRYLERMGRAQAAFGRMVGINRHEINKMIHGRRIPTLKQAVEIERVTEGEVSADAWI